MFSFMSNNHKILVSGIQLERAREEYPDKCIVVTNACVKNERVFADIVAILSKEEYDAIEKPKSIAPKFSVWKGIALQLEEVNGSLGVYS